MADEQNKAVPTPASAPDWMNQPTEGATSAPAPTPQTTIGPDFSAIPGYHPVQQDSPERAQVRSEGGLPQRSTHRDTKAEMGVAPASFSTEPIENYTQAGRAEHPIVAQLGDITKSLKELLMGGQYAGKPMGTESGLLNNPVTQAMSATDAPEIAAAGEELLKTGASKAANAILEHPWATATHPEGSTEAGFASIPGHRELAPPAEVTHTGHAGSINEVKLKQGENDIAALHFTHDGDTASVNDTWVDEAHRGEGHGQHLLREAAAKAKANGAKVFTSDADGATSPDAQHAWDALVRKGEAEETAASKEGFTRVPKYQIKLSEAGAEEKGVPEVGKHLGLSEDKTREIYGVDNPPKPGQDIEGMSGKSANADIPAESANVDIPESQQDVEHQS
jgi:predicted GNAT family acetyltransferase